MRRLKRRYASPKRPWDTTRIKEEGGLSREFGLRRKKEIWSAQQKLRRYRERARLLIAEPDEGKQKVLIQKLAKLGILEKGSTLDDVLALTVNQLLARRLQSIVLKKGMAKTAKQARQFVVHGRVAIGDRRTNIPSHMVTKDEEDQVSWFKGKVGENAKEN